MDGEWASTPKGKAPLNSNEGGSIRLILGCMFSGKTTGELDGAESLFECAPPSADLLTVDPLRSCRHARHLRPPELLRRIRRHSFAKKRCLVVKYSADTRYSQDKASTHDKVMHEATSASRLFKISDELLDSADVIGIDEGQFYPDVVPFAEEMASQGKTIIIAALDGDFRRKGFGNFLELIPMAEEVQKLTAICQICHKEAHFTRRISDEKDVQVVGGADKYIAVCRCCFNAPARSSKAPASAKKAAVEDREYVTPKAASKPSISERTTANVVEKARRRPRISLEGVA